MDVRIAIPDRHVSEGVLNAGLEAVTRVDEALIKEGSAPTFSDAIRQGVRWQPEPPGQESFDHAMKVAARGWGDCDDLAPHRAASLRVSGQDPNAKAVVYKSGPGRWHAIVQRGDGRLEDPSRTAGMSVREGSRAAGIAPAVVGAMGKVVVGGAVRPFVAVRRDDTGYLARVDVPIDDSACLSCVQAGRSPSHALAGCMAGACMVGGASEMVDEDTLDKMWAMQGLMKGAPLKEVAQVVGAEAAKDALLTLREIAPDLVEELRKHWGDARALREDFDRLTADRAQRRAKQAKDATAAGPFVSGRVHKSAAHKAAVTLARWRKQHMHGGDQGAPGATYMAPGEWSSRLAHERVVSPYAERFGHRGSQFVGAATSSPYLEMFAQRRTWGVPRAFVSEQAIDELPERIAQSVGWGPAGLNWGNTPAEWGDRLAHERVVSPFAERFGHRGRQFVGAAAGLPFKPTLSFSLAGEHRGQGGHRPQVGQRHHTAAARIVGEADLAEAVDRALRAPPIVGWDLFKDVVAPVANTVAHTASDVAHAIDTGVKTVAPIASSVLSAAQGVISLVPGIGTGISAAIGAGIAILDGGGPIEIAVKVAYGAIPIPPGVRQFTDMVLDAALSLVHTQNLIDSTIAGIRKGVLAQVPPSAQGLAGTVFDTLAHIVLGHIHQQPTTAVVAPAPAPGFPPKVAALTSAGQYSVLGKVAAAQAAKIALPQNTAATQAAAAPRMAAMLFSKMILTGRTSCSFTSTSMATPALD